MGTVVANSVNHGHRFPRMVVKTSLIVVLDVRLAEAKVAQHSFPSEANVIDLTCHRMKNPWTVVDDAVAGAGAPVETSDGFGSPSGASRRILVSAARGAICCKGSCWVYGPSRFHQ